MHRNLNYHSINGNAQARQNPRYYTGSSQRILGNRLVTVVGVVGFFAGIFVIVYNEATAVQITKMLEESISLVTPLIPEEEVDSSNIGNLVYMTGMMTIHEPLTEVDYGISVLAVKLYRNVQMYQWVETESDAIDRQGNVISTNYHYHTEWNNRVIDSSRFDNSLTHSNPKEFPIKRQTQINENVKIGKYHLGLDLKKQFTNFISITSDERPERQDIKLHAGLYYHCQDIFKPEIGDVRIQFSYAGQHGQIVTIVAKLNDNLTLVPYSTKSGIDILILKLGKYSLEDVFALQHSENKFFTWVYRSAGWLLLYISCVCLTNILQIIVFRFVFLQKIFPVGHSSLRMTVSVCVTLLTTALAWVWYRPILGIGLIIVSIYIFFFNKWFVGNSYSHYSRL